MSDKEMSLKVLEGKFGPRKIQDAIKRVAALAIEVPSWGFGRGGTRFAVYRAKKDAVEVEARIKLAEQFNKITGKGKSVALHFPWDGTTDRDIDRLARALKNSGLRAGSINPNLFTPRGALDARLRFGSLTNPDIRMRNESVAHIRECIDIMRRLGSDVLALWLPDGTNSPGQMSFYDQAERIEITLSETYIKLRGRERILIEYKYFEPGFYSTAIADYGRSRELCRMLGAKAKVLVDLGHHAPTTNVEHLVAMLLWGGDLGGFHFNDHAYADDDLATGSLNPGQLFRIACALVEGEHRGLTPVKKIALMIDQSHNVKYPLLEMVESCENIEIAYAKALLVDWDAMRKAQDNCDPSAADAFLRDAFLTDVRPIVEAARQVATNREEK